MRQVVAPYLRRGGRKRFIQIGNALETTAGPLAAEGWTALRLDPDGRPQDLADAAVPAGGCAAGIEQAQFTDADFLRIDAAERSLESLAGINFGALAPRLIMIGLPSAHDHEVVEAVLAGMRENGYRALVCGHAADTVTLDRATPGALDRTILFFRTADRQFLPSLLGWLEDLARPAASAAPVFEHRPKPGRAPQAEWDRFAAAGGA